MFVVSRACVMVVCINAERVVTLDAMGAAVGCTVLADKHRLTVATNDVSNFEINMIALLSMLVNNL